MSDQHDLSRTSKPGEVRDLTSLLYRRPPPPTGSPAMVQHYAYRIPDLFAPEPHNWLVPVEKFLDDLHERLSQSDIKNYGPNPVPISKDLNRRYRTARVNFSWRSIPVTLTIEVHREYLTISTVMDLSEWKVDKANTTAKKLDLAIRNFDGVAKTRNTKIANKLPIEPGEDRDHLETPHKVIFTETWETFCDEILKAPLGKIGDKLGECFAAGRGFVASLADKESENFILLPNHGVRNYRADPGRPFNEGEDKHEDFRCAHAVLPLLRAGHGLHDLEHSVSQLDGNCLYITALGAKPPEMQIAPMATFLLLATHPNPYQLGWMVDRFCDLGTVRRSGLFDLPQLVKADSALRQIEANLEGTGAKRAKETSGDDVASAPFTKDDLAEVYASLDKAARGKADDDLIQGGLPYRVSQSVAYWRQFNELLIDLNIDSVGDFRSYRELANRRIGDTYGAIAAIGEHYHELTRRVAGYTRQLTVSEMHAAQTDMAAHVGTIAGLQTTIAALTEASNKEAARIDAQTENSNRLLARAEWGFWAVLFPYYSSAFLLHNLLDQQKLETINDLLDQGLDKIIERGSARLPHYLQQVYHAHVHHIHDLAPVYISMAMLLTGLLLAYTSPRRHIT
jgi:hypothetical protein